MQKASQRSHLGTLVLTLSDVRKLIKLASEDVERFSHSGLLSAQIDHVEFSTETLDQLIEEIGEAGDVDELDNLDIYAIGHDRSVMVQLGRWGSIDVSGSDSTWTMGRHAELAEFLQKRRRRSASVYRSLQFLCVATLVFLFVLAQPLWVAGGQGKGVLGSALAVVVILFFTFGRIATQRSRSRIYLRGQATATKKDIWVVVGVVAGVIGALLAAVQVILMVVQA